MFFYLFILLATGVSVGKQVSEMKDGDVCLLENVRFYPEEEKNDKVRHTVDRTV